MPIHPGVLRGTRTFPVGGRPGVMDSFSSKRIWVIAGEHSGDAYGAGIVQAIRRRDSRTSFFGLGGPRMAGAGIELVRDMTRISVTGFIEVLRHLSEYRRLLSELDTRLARGEADIIVLVDYPGFNLRLARLAAKRGIPVVYFVSPQIWAWGRRRIGMIRRTVKRMLVLFDFEEKLYQEHGISVRWVGHPLLDIIPEPVGVVDDDGVTIALFPGSRPSEIAHHAAILLDAARRIRAEAPASIFRMVGADDACTRLLQRHVAEAGLGACVRLETGNAHEVMRESTLAVAASGTLTLEAALLGLPAVVIYRGSWISYGIARCLVRVSHISLPNILAGREIYPELIQGAVTPRRVAEEALALLRDPGRRRRIRGELAEIRRHLGVPGAFERAADEVVAVLSETLKGRGGC
ncbi:MAG: lipid-A-disaccharide synthase [Planctomycetota bacterium]